MSYNQRQVSMRKHIVLRVGLCLFTRSRLNFAQAAIKHVGAKSALKDIIRPCTSGTGAAPPW